MPTRYQELRQAVAILAASAEEQARYLDESFTSLTEGENAADYGNDELALELSDIFHAANDMIEHGELTEAEKEAIRPLDELLAKWSSQDGAAFWRRPSGAAHGTHEPGGTFSRCPMGRDSCLRRPNFGAIA